jgi:amino acid transporter
VTVENKKSSQKMGLLSATSIGIGAMIGAGIFALMGLAVEIAGQLAYLSFIFAGFITLLTAYSVSRLSVTFPQKGGPVTFLNKGFGRSVFSGGLNITMWLGYIIVTSLYARAFGEYGMALFGLKNGLWLHFLSSAVIFIFVLINFAGAANVGRAELLIVAVKVFILLFFGVLGLTTLDVQKLAVPADSHFFDIILAGGIVFMSYEGFGLLANTAEDIRRPKKNVPRGLYLAITSAIVIYLLVSVAVIGNLSIEHIVQAKEYVLAEAAKPIIGSIGFTIMGIAALFSTASAINATIYGPVYMVRETAEAKQLPAFFTRGLWQHDSGWALLTTGAIVLLVTNTLNLDAIAETGSLIFLLVYAAVNIANLKLYKETNSKRIIIWAALAGLFFSFASLAFFLIQQGDLSTVVFVAIILLSFTFEWLYQNLQKTNTERLRKGEQS